MVTRRFCLILVEFNSVYIKLRFRKLILRSLIKICTNICTIVLFGNWNQVVLCIRQLSFKVRLIVILTHCSGKTSLPWGFSLLTRIEVLVYDEQLELSYLWFLLSINSSSDKKSFYKLSYLWFSRSTNSSSNKKNFLISDFYNLSIRVRTRKLFINFLYLWFLRSTNSSSDKKTFLNFLICDFCGLPTSWLIWTRKDMTDKDAY